MDLLHGTPVADPFRWLEVPDSAQTTCWVAEQDRLWRGVRDALPHRDWWRAQVSSYLDVDFASTPISRGRWQFTMRHTRGGRGPGLYAERSDGFSHNLLEALPATLPGVGELQTWQPSLEGDLVAVTVAEGGSEEASLWIVDAEAGSVVDGPITGCGHTSIAWPPGGASLIYARLAPGSRQRRVYEHRVGSPAKDDSVVFASEASGARYFRVSAGRDGRWLAVSASDGSPASGNRLWLGDLRAEGRPRFVRVQGPAEGSSGITIGPDGLLYILTDRDAPNRRIMVAAADRPEPASWRELVGADDGAIVADFAILDRLSRLVVAWTRDAVSEVSVHDLATGELLDRVPLPGAGRVGPLATRDGEADRVRFSYADLTTSPRTCEYDVAAGTLRTEGAGREGSDAPTPVTERRWCESPDGTRVQMILVRPAGSSGPLPTILSGYGGFGVSMTPTYSPTALAWVRAGGCYVMANTRGGGERGERWHEAGRGHHKQAVFDDFIACAQALIDDGLTTPSRLAVWGASNGALLASAMVTQRPDLFAAVVGYAPLCDMVRYERTGMGALWRSEYGTAADPEDFRHLLAYSPYHQVTEGRHYPAVLFAVSDADERVDPSHARKMSAALQYATASSRPVLLRRESRGGHSNRALGSAIELLADTLAFVAEQTGLTDIPELADS